MKTSFYFVIWIIIYPILGLFNNSVINESGFFIALFLIWGLSRLLNKAMPETINYERATRSGAILNDVYTGNVSSFWKRLRGQLWVQMVTAAYFCLATAVLAYACFAQGVNGWIALVIFAFFGFSVASRSNKIYKAYAALKSNPTAEECRDIAENTYGLDYTYYHTLREQYGNADILPPRPRHYTAFQWFSIVVAAISALFGLLYIVIALVVAITAGLAISAQAVAWMYLLYGSLAFYYGVKDFISIIKSFRRK